MTSLIDGFGRPITYLRLSVTDRCDFRCVYCMAEEMKFLPLQQILSIEEMVIIAQNFVELGIQRIRITGGEPLIRRGIEHLFNALGEMPNLEEITLTTNGSHLHQHIDNLLAAGVKRINISLDSLQAQRFTSLTRTGDLSTVLQNIDLALAAGLHIKLNSVVLKHSNSDEINDLVEFALSKAIDISFIEEMPLGQITDRQREQDFISSEDLRNQITQDFTLSPSTATTGGPSRYWKTDNSESLIGFISPHSENFCASCNRIRLTAEGKLLLCLGNEDSVDLKHIIRHYPNDNQRIKRAIQEGLTQKPEKHHFGVDGEPEIVRFMNATGG
jgi:cyclic pyranopterin phosphate synthase